MVVTSRANTGPIRQRTPVLFKPDTTSELPEGIEMEEQLLYVKQGYSSMIKVIVYNLSKHNITLQGHSMIGTLQLVRSVTVAEVKESQGKGSDNQKLSEQRTEQSSMAKEPLPEVALSNLTVQQ